MSKIIPSIYKIDLEKLDRYAKNNLPSYILDDASVSSHNAHSYIKKIQDYRRENDLSDAKPFTILQNGEQTVGNNQVVVYGTSSAYKDHEWQDLFPEQIGELKTKRQNLAAFMAFEDSCYAISAGNGHVLFEQFIDTSFPLDIAKRIMNPELDGTTERAITGVIYGRMQQFRTSQMIASSQNLGTIWQIIKGKINDETRNSNEFQYIFDSGTARVNMEAGSSVTIRRSIQINKLLDLIGWLIDIINIEPSDQQKESFRFLDSLKEVSPRKDLVLIDELKSNLCEGILDSLLNGKQIDLDFSHRNFELFQSAKQYEFAKKCINTTGFPTETAPTADEVLRHLYDGGFLRSNIGKDLAEELEGLEFCAIHDDSINNCKSSVLNHLHGEVCYKDKHYFLIDGKWYTAEDSFIDRIGKDFDSLLNGEFVQKPANLDFLLYDLDADEGAYNESYTASAKWLVGDRAFLRNVELADLIGWDNEILFIVHNKTGFGVTVRDVCSQILHSMNILTQLRANGDVAEINKYYDSIISKHYNSLSPPITRQEFTDKLLKTDSKNIVYILGYADNKPVTTSCQSNIAKFESVKLCMSDKRAFDFDLKIVYLEPKK